MKTVVHEETSPLHGYQDADGEIELCERPVQIRYYEDGTIDLKHIDTGEDVACTPGECGVA